MNESIFWSIIEDAWSACPEPYLAHREALLHNGLPEDELLDLLDGLDDMIPALREILSDLKREELLQFDRIMERKLYDIDRAELQEYTDGSDDGFLYARGFIVACGRRYYDAVNADPSIAIMDADCEEICYLSLELYEKKYGPAPHSEISRESASNAEGWPEA